MSLALKCLTKQCYTLAVAQCRTSALPHPGYDQDEAMDRRSESPIKSPKGVVLSMVAIAMVNVLVAFEFTALPLALPVSYFTKLFVGGSADQH